LEPKIASGNACCKKNFLSKRIIEYSLRHSYEYLTSKILVSSSPTPKPH